MPITLRTTEMAYRDNSGQYVGINGVSERTTAEQIAAVEAAGEHVLEDVIPHDWTELTEDFDDIKENIVMSSSTEPDEENNRIWLKPMASETAIPTYDEFSEVANASESNKIKNSFLFDTSHIVYELPYAERIAASNSETWKSTGTQYFTCVEGDSFTILMSDYNGIGTRACAINFYDNSDTLLDSYGAAADQNKKVKLTRYAPANAVKVGCVGYMISSGTSSVQGQKYYLRNFTVLKNATVLEADDGYLNIKDKLLRTENNITG